ncbi:MULTISPECIES: 30S ribosomal protein S8 [Anaerococcus]|uniref:Small ribosomal subunit protein uS8 n=3 Tax=Anaerococcus hydrogenalis TaxID=33029 RepID=F0H1W2_9FIRM|nr:MULTISPECIES: 30S ribosomal protein S8 [Anaerococcus]EEB35323.1 ribosomal protein S8 [Anaerococcus hydrogenalis DSM 7454]EGC83469.1 ribosomal protein S8 [Anaerococcus hydrogenalis ACS-025-V-Sch4]MBS5988199.1 30S ribosomal protein S8 [Anaerococcus hydrogenalis]MDK7694798.1 30S ribosomal protein S8 [Anaerococcus hydrogenalis]MDK7696648.1 30S ribosomal protein S8 [Anaerococcus hydrogenalis]
MMTDPIADMLTRIRNGNKANHTSVSLPSSNEKRAIAQILLDEGYIKGFDVEEDNKQGILTIDLKYAEEGEKVITGLRRISKPGLRVYVKANEVPKVLDGLGIAIISTSKGLLTDKAARDLNVGGEVMCYVW